MPNRAYARFFESGANTGGHMVSDNPPVYRGLDVGVVTRFVIMNNADQILIDWFYQWPATPPFPPMPVPVIMSYSDTRATIIAQVAKSIKDFTAAHLSIVVDEVRFVDIDVTA